jgi:hypothetical protein
LCRIREIQLLAKQRDEARERITQLEQENDAMRADLLLWENGGPAAFVFKHRKTGQVIVAPSERWHEYYDNKENWEHTTSLNACGALQYIIDAKPAERNRYIKRLTEYP